MAEGDKIKYSDIIEPDDAITVLISQLDDLNASYETMVKAIKAGADRIAHSIKSVSGATAEGRKAIDAAAEASTRLERAQYELDLALSDTGKQIAWLKAQTLDANKATVEQQRYIKQAISSYDRLKSDLKENIALYRSLTDAERADSEMGGVVLSNIISLKTQIKALDDQMRPYIKRLSEVEKAEQRLAYLQSEEGQYLIELKAKINDLISARSRHKAAIDPLVQAEEKLMYAKSEENRQLKAYAAQIREANRLAQLEARLANSAEGSYNRLAAQYEINKIKLNAMSAAEREAAEAGKKLEAETRGIYQQMIKLQEATGNYRLSVGHYEKMWDRLGFSVVQVVRELPAAAISLNTLFLAVSNNIPIVIDEINRTRALNKKAIAEGKEATSVIGSITKAIFSWNTILVIAFTTLSMYGNVFGEWIRDIISGEKKVLSLKERINALTEELKENTGGYGDNVSALMKLSSQYKNLTDDRERIKWVRDNVSEFNKLGIAVNSVKDAEVAFVGNTPEIIDAMKQRAIATANMSLASKALEKAIQKEQEAAEKEFNKDSNFLERASDYFSAVAAGFTKAERDLSLETRLAKRIGQQRAKNIESLRDDAKKERKNAQAFIDAANEANGAMDDLLKKLGLFGKSRAGEKGREPKDLTETIYKNSIKAQRLYEESVTALQNDEFAKRRKTATDQVQNENNKLREMFRENEEYIANVDNKYKQLTESQKAQIEQQQKWISATIDNNLEALHVQLMRIQKEQQANSLKLRREFEHNMYTGDGEKTIASTSVIVTHNPYKLEESLVKERKLMEESLKLEYELTLATNKKLLDAGDEHARSEEEILIEFTKKKFELLSKYDEKILNARERNIENQLTLVEKGTERELELLVEQNEIRRQIALAQNVVKPAEEQVSTDAINAEFDKALALLKGRFQLDIFDRQQELDKALFEETERSETELTRFKLEQERNRWQEQIYLAEAGGLEWSKLQIDTAKATVRGINRELSELDDFMSNVGKKGLGNTLLERLGFDDDQIGALKSAVNIVVEQLQSILDAEVELARQAVEIAEKRVEAAQAAYDAEVEARNNGYANNAASAKRKLMQERQNLREKEKIEKEAQKRQEAVNSVMQANSLITASALIWSQLGFPFAIPAIATMWASFAVAKIKARQVTAQQEQEYGEGGLEILEGGSHASGNDIDLGVYNGNKKRMKAEGGEALAIINKKQTRRYSRILPDVVNSLNKGVFEEKYLNAFQTGADDIALQLNGSSSVDLSQIENDVNAIRHQNDNRIYTLPNGTIVIQTGNVKRIIKN